MAQETLRKVTFSLPGRMVEQLKTSAASAGYPSQNALVREVLARELKRIRNERLEREMEGRTRPGVHQAHQRVHARLPVR